jgi:hypothetical protein
MHLPTLCACREKISEEDAVNFSTKSTPSLGNNSSICNNWASLVLLILQGRLRAR